jgi:UDP-glucose 4-epimerase
MAGAEVVFHLGALASVQRSVEAPPESHAICATGTLHVLDAARRHGVRRVVYAASASAYGIPAGEVQSETDPVCPLSPYAAAKPAGEMYAQAFTGSYGLETVRLRFFNIFGPRQRPDSPYSGVISIFTALMAAGKTPVVHGDGLQSRDFTYVGDVVQALLKAADAPGGSGQVYNVGTGRRVTLLDLVATLNRVLGTSLEPGHGPPRAGDVRHSRADISRARRDLGYEPAVSFEEGLRRTVSWYRESAGGER